MLRDQGVGLTVYVSCQACSTTHLRTQRETLAYNPIAAYHNASHSENQHRALNTNPTRTPVFPLLSTLSFRKCQDHIRILTITKARGSFMRGLHEWLWSRDLGVLQTGYAGKAAAFSILGQHLRIDNVGFTHRPLGSSFLWFIFRIL